MVVFFLRFLLKRVQNSILESNPQNEDPTASPATPEFHEKATPSGQVFAQGKKEGGKERGGREGRKEGGKESRKEKGKKKARKKKRKNLRNTQLAFFFFFLIEQRSLLGPLLVDIASEDSATRRCPYAMGGEAMSCPIWEQNLKRKVGLVW